MPITYTIPTLPQPNLLEDNLRPDFDHDEQNLWQPIDDGSLADETYLCSDFENQLDCLNGSRSQFSLDHLKLATDLPWSNPVSYQMSHTPWHSRAAYNPQQQVFSTGTLVPQWPHDHLSTDQESCSNASAWSARGAESQTDYEVMSNGCASWSGPPEAMSPEVSFSKSTLHHSAFMSGHSVAATPVTPSGVADRPQSQERHWAIDPSQLSAYDKTPHDLEQGQLVTEQHLVLPVQLGPEAAIQPATSEPSMDHKEMDTAVKDEDSDYSPRGKQPKPRRRSAPALGAKAPTNSTQSRRVKDSRITKRISKKATKAQRSSTNKKGKEACVECAARFPSVSALHKHTLNSHRRPFTCTFRRYGCASTFGSKNEWKRHVSSQHLRLGVYRCDQGACMPQARHHGRKASSTSVPQEDLIYNEFNRKDLFTQHVRRMHDPNKRASKEVDFDFEGTLEATRQRCWRLLRDPPSCSACGFCAPDPKTKQPVVFSGPGSWDERMEHVGRHLEKCEKDCNEEEDVVLRNWLIQEGLLEWTNGGGKIVGVGCKGKLELGDEDADGEYE